MSTFSVPCLFTSYKIEVCNSKNTRYLFVKQGCPWRQQSQNIAGQVMSVKCEEPIDELRQQKKIM